MKIMPFIKSRIFLFVLFCALLVSGTVWATQSSGSVSAAFQVARTAVGPEVQTKVISAYGTGTPSQIQKWYFIFFDPTVSSHGRAVLVQNNQITKTYPANGGVTYSSTLTFDPSRIASEGPALSAAQAYAAKHHIVYDSVSALLKQTSVNKPFCWKIGLIDHGTTRGFVQISALDDQVIAFESPDAAAKKTAHSEKSSAEGFGNDVKKTFLGVGGDLEEFFTGERTVDK